MDIIVAVDLNAHPKWAVDAAVGWAQRLDATLHLRTVSTLLWDPQAIFGSDNQALVTEWAHVRRLEVRALRVLLEDRVPEAHRGTAEVLTGPLDVAMANAGVEADLVLCATHGRHGLLRMFYGSSSEAVVRASPAPTLVGRLTEAGPGPVRTERVLVAVDPADPSTVALDTVRRWFPTASVTLLSVLIHPDLFPGRDLWEQHPPSADEHPRRDWALEVLKPMADGLAEAPRLVGARGEGPGGPIAKAAAEYDLVALTTHHRRGLPRLWWGSVAERVVRLAEVPVLVVPR